MITTIIFDMGGVLNTLHLHTFFSHLRELANSQETFPHERKWGKELTTSKITLDQYFENLYREYDIPLSKEEYLRKLQETIEWHENLFNFIEKELKGKFQLVIFSNNSELFINSQTREHLSKLFDKQFYSFDMHLKKPQNESYEYVLKNLNKKPTECLFIDDKKKNLYPAKNLGIDCILYQSLDKLKLELKEKGLIF